MVPRFPSLQEKIGQLMEDYIQALRSKDDTPGSLLTMTRAAEAAILDKYQADVSAQQEGELDEWDECQTTGPQLATEAQDSGVCCVFTNNMEKNRKMTPFQRTFPHF